MKQQKWSDLDRERFAEQRLRARTQPAKRFDGPDVSEWGIDVVDGADGLTPDMLRQMGEECPWCGRLLEQCACDEPLLCGVENPEECESCQ